MNNIHDTLMYMLAFANLVSMLHLGAYIVGANTYDILQLRKKSKQSGEKKPTVMHHPLVSVVIPAHNESKVIARTLDSVRASTYDNIEVVVVDDGSTDNTDAMVRDYIAHLPLTKTSRYMAFTSSREAELASNAHQHQVRYHNKLKLNRRFVRVPTIRIRTAHVYQTNGGKAVAMNNAIRNFVRGDLVMCLDADSMIHPTAVENAVKYFESPKIIGVAANVRIMNGKGWLTMLQRFEHMIGYRSKKFYSLFNCEFIVGGVASTYRTEALREVNLYDTDTQTEDIGLSLKMLAYNGNKDKRIVYAADVVAMTEGVQTFSALLRQRYRWKLGALQNLFKYRALIGNRDGKKYSRALTMYRLPMAIVSECMLLIEPLLLSYIVYLSIANRTVGILLGAYMTITLYTLWNVWPDEHLTTRQKLRMSFSALIIYILFYAMSFVQLAAVYKAMKNRRSIFDLSRTHGTWVSPARAGAAVTFSS